MDEKKYIKININPLQIVVDIESSILYAIGPNGIAERILVSHPHSDLLGTLILDPEKHHNWLHENGFVHDHSECEEDCCNCDIQME